MSFAGYPDFKSCVADHQDAKNPEALCAWLEHQTTGKWPGEMTQGLPVDVAGKFWQAFDVFMTKEKDEVKAIAFADEAASALGWIRMKQGWMHQANQKMGTRTVYGVPIFAIGTHNGDKYTVKDMDDMVSAFKALSGRVDPPVKIGHTSDEFNKALALKMGIEPELIKGEAGNGIMAFGWVDNLRVSGDVMYADLTDVPEPIADLIESKSYKKVSAEIMFDYQDKGKTYPKVLTGLALLGAELPAVKESGLETAAVYMVVNKPDSVIEFALNSEEVTYEELRPALSDIDKSIDTVMKGRAGVGIIRAMWKELQQKVNKMFEKKYAEEGDVFEAYPWDQCMREQTDRYGNEETAAKVCAMIRRKSKGLSLTDLPEMLSDVETELNVNPKKKEEEVMNKEILKMLSLDEKANDEGVMAAIKKLQEPPAGPDLKAILSALGLSEGAGMAEIVSAINALKSKAEGGGAEMKKFTDRVAQLETDNKKLKRDGRKAHYKDIAGELKAISGTPDELAEELVKLEEAGGEDVAKVVLGRYQDQNKRLIAAGVFKVKGTAAEGDGSDEHEFNKKVKAYMDKEGVDEPTAFAALRKSEPKLYRDFMAKRRIVTAEAK